MTSRTRVAIVVLCLWVCQPLVAGPFDSDSTVQIAPAGGTSFEQKLESTERQITTGIQKIGSALDTFSAKIDTLVRDLKSAGSSSGSAIAPGGCYGSSSPAGAQAPQGSTGSNSGQQVGDAFKDFLKKAGEMFKAIGNWAKCFWKEITGPSKDEAPITSTLNGIKTDWAGHSVKATAKSAGQSAIGLFTSIGNFFKSIFS